MKNEPTYLKTLTFITKGVIVMMKSRSIIAATLCVAFVTLFFASCGNDDKSSTGPTDTSVFEIVGIWEVTKIGNDTNVGGSNSTLNCKADSTYEWFLQYADRDFEGEGTYSLDNDSFTADGIIAECYGLAIVVIQITISNNNNTFSFTDPDGTPWSYNRKQSPSPIDTSDFVIVGRWGVTEIEGAPPVDSSNSTWTFKADGTYEWFFLYPGIFDWSSEGSYNLDGTTLTCDGFITQVTGTSNIELKISEDQNTFSFLNDEGERWTYSRLQ